ncbi:polysaccharide biosynthesis protein GtrA [Paenibacillus sp. CAA11]|uniref:GtrA family protein n=1 Tax=Paenibacillus sp. CAA11 TaxID=1532905 RepID=UPI000D34CBAF|nr:GtrA family protein [Paenibacillus sp. CAA11]AWB45492.1 polysaccharide biosynthesis protein GtrA [Paenibacillus sp. CAA11]
MSGKAVSKVVGSGFIRFALVGIVNTLIGLSVTFICLNALGFNYWISTLVGNVVGAVNSYFMNKSFTFRSTASIRATLWRFMAVTAVCYAVAYGAAAVAAQQLLALVLPSAGARLQDNLAALAGSGLYTIMNYFGQKRITFSRKETELREGSNE